MPESRDGDSLQPDPLTNAATLLPVYLLSDFLCRSGEPSRDQKPDKEVWCQRLFFVFECPFEGVLERLPKAVTSFQPWQYGATQIYMSIWER